MLRSPPTRPLGAMMVTWRDRGFLPLCFAAESILRVASLMGRLGTGVLGGVVGLW